MRRVLIIRTLLAALCWCAAVAMFAVATARYTEARRPHTTPTTVCCPAGTTGHSDGWTP